MTGRAMILKALKEPLEAIERDDLEPGPGEAVVRVHAAALNRRDYWITQGLYPGVTPGVVLGSDAAGTVVRCAEDVDPVWIDREVVVNPGFDWGHDLNAQADEFSILGMPRDGSFATEVIVPVSQLYSRPAHLDWNESAALPLAGVTAYRAVFTQGQLRAGENVLITGIGGGVALYALQFCALDGARVWVTSSSADKTSRARDLGAVGGFDYTQEKWWKEVSEEDRPSLIIDGAGGAGYPALIDLVAPGGRIVNYGATAGATENFELFRVFWKQVTLRGTTMGSPEDFSAMLEFVNRHALHPLIDQVFPLDEVNEALSLMESSPQFGKYVLSVQ